MLGLKRPEKVRKIESEKWGPPALKSQRRAVDFWTAGSEVARASCRGYEDENQPLGVSPHRPILSNLCSNYLGLGILNGKEGKQSSR
jgi:hypothetical protein